MIKWFLIEDNTVTGPFSTQEVKSYCVHGRISTDQMIWGRLSKQWQKVSQWLETVDGLVGEVSDYVDQTRQWHYSLGGKTYGPFEREELVQQLFGLLDHSKVYLWTQGMDDWAPIYDFHDIMDDVGVNQRVHTRAKMEGSVVLSKGGEEAVICRLDTVSEGGVGFYGVTNLVPGETVNIEIRSPHLSSSISTKAEVRYVSEKNYLGLRFIQLNSEAKSQIIAYIKSATSTVMDDETKISIKVA